MCANSCFEQADTKRFIPLAALFAPLGVTQSLSVLCCKIVYYKILPVQYLPRELDPASRMQGLPMRSTMVHLLCRAGAEIGAQKRQERGSGSLLCAASCEQSGVSLCSLRLPDKGHLPAHEFVEQDCACPEQPEHSCAWG